jgi:hypothetical protein
MQFAALQDDDAIVLLVVHEADLALVISLDAGTVGVALEHALQLVGFVAVGEEVVELLDRVEGDDDDEEGSDYVELQVLVCTQQHDDRDVGL